MALFEVQPKAHYPHGIWEDFLCQPLKYGRKRSQSGWVQIPALGLEMLSFSGHCDTEQLMGQLNLEEKKRG